MVQIDISKGIKYTNLIGGAFLMILGFLYLLNRPVIINPTFFIPVYLMIFGSMGILVEFNNEWILDNCKFMRNYFGRGLFDIFLSTIAFGFYNEYDESFRSIFALIIGILYLIIGIIYLVMTCKQVYYYVIKKNTLIIKKNILFQGINQDFENEGLLQN